jgi:hypothetical protein
MEWLAQLQEQVVGLDSAPLIYFTDLLYRGKSNLLGDD